MHIRTSIRRFAVFLISTASVTVQVSEAEATEVLLSDDGKPQQPISSQGAPMYPALRGSTNEDPDEILLVDDSGMPRPIRAKNLQIPARIPVKHSSMKLEKVEQPNKTRQPDEQLISDGRLLADQSHIFSGTLRKTSLLKGNTAGICTGTSFPVREKGRLPETLMVNSLVQWNKPPAFASVQEAEALAGNEKILSDEDMHTAERHIAEDVPLSEETPVLQESHIADITDSEAQDEVALALGGAEVSEENLDASRGTGGVTLTSEVLGVSIMEAVVVNNSAQNSASGDNFIADSVFENAQGVITIIQNSGNQAVIQSATIVNLSLQ